MRVRTAHVDVVQWRSLTGLLVILMASLVIAYLASAAGPTAHGWLFQSPLSPIGPGPGESPVAPQETATGPALVSVPAPPNFVPWLMGLAVIMVVVGVTMWWRGRREEGRGTE
jgi:hypothetical protein